jgi:TonB family protein
MLLVLTLNLTIMKEFKKHIHGISAAFIFIFICVAVLILTGFSTPLPLPEEEAVIIDFSNSGQIDIDKSDLSEANNSSEGSNSESSREILSDNSDNIYVPSGNSNDENLDKIDKINNLFGNPFGEFGDSENDGDNPFGDNGNNKHPGEISGKLDKSRSYTGDMPTARDNMVGKVVLEITVDEKGNVTSVILKSTSCNECVQAAKDAVAKWKYEPRPGTGFQTGTIVIEFKQI